ncbi:hypothetical protein KA012_00200 [Candidatus Woesebacteria bacterium]|nr:hypothetical protein [Candidatus Woesebacteria bacterium]
MWTVLLATVAIAVFSLTISLSWLPNAAELRFQQGVLHDSVWHVALIKEIQAGIPTRHPSSFTETITNYHYYYDLLLATTSSATGVAPSLLQYQVFPVLLATLLVIGVLFLSMIVTTDQRLARWLLFFTFFGGNAGFLIPFFLDRTEWGESTFWVSQTFTMMINPQLILSFSIITVLIGLLISYLKKNNSAILPITFLLTMSLAGTKMYSFIIAGFLLGLVLFWKLLQTRKISFLVWLGLLAVVSGGLFLRFTDSSKAGLIYEPLWFINTMVEAPDRLNVIDWKLREENYLANGGYIRYVLLKTKEIAIFYGGNLGSRIICISLPFLWYFGKRKSVKRSFESSFIILLFCGFLFSTSIPLFFIQSGVVWNTIQFWYYGLLFASLLAGFTVWKGSILLENRPLLKWLAVAVVVVTTLPAWIRSVPSQIQTSETIPSEVVAQLNVIKASDKVLICPQGKGSAYTYNTSLVRALGSGEVYFANPVQLELVGLNGYDQDTKYRQETKNPTEVAELIRKHSISIVLCGDADWTSQMADTVSQSSARLLSF